MFSNIGTLVTTKTHAPVGFPRFQVKTTTQVCQPCSHPNGGDALSVWLDTLVTTQTHAPVGFPLFQVKTTDTLVTTKPHAPVGFPRFQVKTHTQVCQQCWHPNTLQP